jgi:hypothetical protein
MISNKQAGIIAFSTITAVIVLSVSGPFVATHQAWAWGDY